MTTDELIERKFSARKRFVEVCDAEFVLSLRMDDKLGRFLSATNNDINRQQEWIKQYKQREAANEEFYFLFEAFDETKYGVSRIYNIDRHSFEVGSWLFSPNAPEGLSILADLSARDFAFSKFGFDYCRFEVRKQNKSVVAYHKRFNPTQTGEDDDNYYFRLSKGNYTNYRNKLMSLYSYGIK
jgi:RimJ/RimL family protein N-acetyltransferase